MLLKTAESLSLCGEFTDLNTRLIDDICTHTCVISNAIERFKAYKAWLADNERITVSNLARKFLPVSVGHRDQQHYVCCENSL